MYKTYFRKIQDMFDSGISNIKMIHFQGETQITTRLPLDDYPCPQIITKQIIRKRSLYEHTISITMT